MRDLVETALGALLVAGLALAVLILPSVLIDMAAGTDLLGPAAMALLFVLSAAAILGIVVIWQKRRPSGKQGTADRKGTADRD